MSVEQQHPPPRRVRVGAGRCASLPKLSHSHHQVLLRMPGRVHMVGCWGAHGGGVRTGGVHIGIFISTFQCRHSHATLLGRPVASRVVKLAEACSLRVSGLHCW